MRQYLLVFGFWVIGAVGAMVYDRPEAIAIPAALAEGEPEIAVQSKQAITNIPTVSEVEQPLTTAEGLLVQQPAPSSAVPAQVTGVQLKPTEQGLEVILETTTEFVEVLSSETENSLITDLPNAQLRLPQGGAFRQDNPTKDVASVEVTNLDAKTIRVTVTGKAGVPTAEVSQSPQALILSVAAPPAPSTPAPTTPPPATPAPELPPAEPQQPEATTPEQQTPPPAAPQPEPQAEEGLLELTVRAEEEEGYNVPDATTATRTDTPIQNVPASIQVIPQQVIEDQGATNLGETLRNASGVTTGRTSAGSRAITPLIRGFESENILRNGLRDDTLRLNSGITNIERVEILKGPASVLFGSGTLSGTVNLITEVPLFEPRYEAKFTLGNNAFYQPLIDLAGPADASGETAYRLNVAYESQDSFQDFENRDFFFIAPALQLINTDQTSLIVDLEYLTNRTRGTAPLLPAVSAIGVEDNTYIDTLLEGGAQIPAEDLQAAGTLDIRSNLGEPDISRSETNTTRVGYRFEHELNDIWTIRNQFLGAFQDTPQDSSVIGTDFARPGGQPNLNLLSRIYLDNPSSRQIYTLNTDVVGNFEIAGIDQTLLLGFEWSQENQQDKIFQRFFLRSPDEPFFNIFNPNYDSSRFFDGSDFNQTISADSTTRSRTIGLYGQTQLNFLDERLIVVLGGRFDFADQWFEDLANRADPSPIETSDTAFSPRVGVVVKPIETISLYGSYTESFNPTIGRGAAGEVFGPEDGNQFEVGVKADFLDNRLSTTLAYYRLRRSNVLTQDVDNLGQQVQVGEQGSDGFEFDLTGEILPGWNVIANYAYTNARILEDDQFPSGRELENVPEHAASLWTTYEIQDGDLQGLGFGLGIYFQGERNGELERPFVIPSFVRTDASIFYRRGQFRTQLNFLNLFDTRYFEGARDQFRVIPGAPFGVLASVEWEF